LIENQLIGVNDSKIAVGFYIDASGLSHGYTYEIKSGAFSANIDDPSAISGGIVVGSTVRAAINNKGDIAGFYTDTGPTNTASIIHGFVDNHGVFTSVDAPGATTTELLGLNDQGIAVGFDVDVNGMHGIIYDTKTGKLTTVDAPNGINPTTSTTFNGINDKGDIVGFYTDTTGQTHGLLVETVGIVLHHEVWSVQRCKPRRTAGAFLMVGYLPRSLEAIISTGPGAIAQGDFHANPQNGECHCTTSGYRWGECST
jgi:hypothetical protein